MRAPRRTSRLPCCLAIVFLPLAGLPGGQVPAGGSAGLLPPAGQEALFTLQVPELSLEVPAGGTLDLPRADLSRLRILVRRSPSQVSYGNVLVKINTQPANTILATSATPEGIACDLDLGRLGGLALRPGRNSVEIAIKDNIQRRSYGRFLLVSKEESTAPAAPPPVAPEPVRGARWALVVGVSRHRQAAEGPTDLRFADRDAEAVREFLASAAGGTVPVENIDFLTNETATTAALREAFSTFLSRAQAEDLVVVFFSGQAAEDPRDPRNLYLVTHDTSPADVAGTALPLTLVQDALTRRLRARQVVALFDVGRGKGSELISPYLVRYASDGGRTLIAGSDAGQTSLEDERWGGGHGVFTWALLKGLGGAADASRDGSVTAGELASYVRSEVRQATDAKQLPVSTVATGAGLALAVVPAAGSALAAGPEGSEATLAAGIRRMDAGDMEGAVGILTRVVRTASEAGRAAEASEAHLYLGLAYDRLGHEKAARASFREALKLDRNVGLPPASATPKLLELFAEARRQALGQ